MNYLVAGKSPCRLGNAHPNIVPYQDFRTRDGHMILAVGNDAQFQRFCHACERPEWADDPRFSTNSARIAHRDALIADIANVMIGHDTAYWITLLEEAGVPCGPINTIEEAFADPHVAQRNTQISIESPQKGNVPTVANPIRLAPPGLGQDTRQVLREYLGLEWLAKTD